MQSLVVDGAITLVACASRFYAIIELLKLLKEYTHAIMHASRSVTQNVALLAL